MRLKRKSALGDFACRPVGSAVVVSRPDQQPDPATLALARALPPDPLRTVVVADLRGDRDWGVLVTALRHSGPVRLAISGHGSARHRGPAPAQWLADQLGTEVLAPDGLLVQVPGGPFFVLGPNGAGRWHRFTPGTAPTPADVRFPAPQWERVTPQWLWRCGETAFAEPIPAGLWLHSSREGALRGEHAGYAQPVFALPGRSDMLTVVLGCPGQSDIGVDDVRRLLEGLPPMWRSRVRFAPYGGAPGGQELADHLGYPVITFSGVPTAMDVVAAGPAGEPSWRPFATELSYVPQGESPTVLARRRLAFTWPESVPGVFRLSEEAVVEVVASGLWIREPAQPRQAHRVRGLPVDPEWVRVTVGSPGVAVPQALERAVNDVIGFLEPQERRLLRLMFSDGGAPGEPAAPSPAIADEVDRDWPTLIMPVITEEPEPVVEPEPVPVAEVVIDYPDHPLETIDPTHRASQAERQWLRQTLGARYDSYVSGISRTLAEFPGLRAGAGESAEALLSDLVAVRVYLSATERKLDSALRAGRLGPLRAFAGCVVSGVRRLPSSQGVVFGWGAAGEAGWLPGDVVLERGLLNALSTPAPAPDGAVQFVLWSLTGRRTGAVEPESGDVGERVVFLPGTRFAVLDVVPGKGSRPTRVLCREVFGAAGRGEAALREKLSRAAAQLDALPAAANPALPDCVLRTH